MQISMFGRLSLRRQKPATEIELGVGVGVGVVGVTLALELGCMFAMG